MGFDDDMDRQIASTARARAAQTSEAVALEKRLLEERTKFKREFAAAVDFLRKRGVQDRRVVYIDHHPKPVYTGVLNLGQRPPPDFTVFPFTALPIGGFFLHEGRFYLGRFELSSFGSIFKGLRKGDPVVNLYGPKLVSCDNAFRFSDRPHRQGVADGTLWYVTGGPNDDGAQYLDPHDWLIRGTEKALEGHTQR
jgi:hypothetical protein